MKAVNTARLNVKAAGLTNEITIEHQDFKDFKRPAEESIIIMNPPYGERISTPNLLGSYKMIGERLKHEFGGNEAWILSYREECFDQIGLKPSIKFPVYNGSLECEFRKYSLFDGRMKEFRAEGGIVKTDREKQEMAQKHRFKANREFKTRIDEESNNEEGDIRSFTFHKHEMGDFAGGRKRIDHDDRRGGFGGKREDSRGSYGKRPDDKRGSYGDRRGGFGGKREDSHGSYGDRRARFSGKREDSRGSYGNKPGDKRGSFEKSSTHTDSED